MLRAMQARLKRKGESGPIVTYKLRFKMFWCDWKVVADNQAYNRGMAL